jgi:hypothetical protein
LTTLRIATIDIVSEETSGMAAVRNNPTRRAVLGAAVAVPVVFAGRAYARPELEARWDRALTDLRRAEAAEESFCVSHMHPADHAYHDIRDRWPRDYDFESDPEAQAEFRAAFAAHSRMEDRLNDLHIARLTAIKRLLRIPAPDMGALALKIELAVDHQIAELSGGERCMAALKRDARALALGTVPA